MGGFKLDLQNFDERKFNKLCLQLNFANPSIEGSRLWWISTEQTDFPLLLAIHRIMSLPEVRVEVSIAHVMTTISNDADNNTRTNNWRIILKFMHRKRSAAEKLVGEWCWWQYSVLRSVTVQDWSGLYGLLLAESFSFCVPPAISPSPKYEEEPDEDH